MASTSRTAVHNPLTLMAIFAGLAEVSATVALPRLEGNVQAMFVWFVMFFPLTIVVPFFLFLWLNPKNLYGPGDYRSDPSHLTGAEQPRPASTEKKKEKMKASVSKKNLPEEAA